MLILIRSNLLRKKINKIYFLWIDYELIMIDYELISIKALLEWILMRIIIILTFLY